jgi:hypothetical protein
MKRISMLLSMLLALSAGAQDLSQFERILLPAFTAEPVIGFPDTTFRVGLEIFSGTTFRYFPDYANQIATSEPGNRLVTLGLRGFSRGRFMFVERNAADDVRFGYQLESTPAGGPTILTTLPVVREKDAITGLTDIMLVPYEFNLVPLSDGISRTPVPVYRRTLYVYSLDSTPGAVFNVRVLFGGYLQPRGTVLRTMRVTADRRDHDDPTYPWYAAVNLDDICLPFSRHTPCISFQGVVEIEPESRSPYYPMISVTSNETQQVTIRTRQ